MPDLGTLVEFGPRLKWNAAESAGGRWQLELPLRGVFDLSDQLTRRGMSFEPELQFSRRSAAGFDYSVGLGAVFGDRRLAETFYSVAPAFATAERAAYDARAGLIAWRLGLSASRLLTPDWRVFGLARIDSVAGAANRASPLVQRTAGATVLVGVAWTWMRSERSEAD
jgi:outer membrane scaffolding protein for murein synthesis (MipA/OmpV family)